MATLSFDLAAPDSPEPFHNAGIDFLKKLGFERRSIDVIFRVVRLLGLNGSKRARPDLFSIAVVNTLIAMVGFNVDASLVLALDSTDRATMIEYQSTCRAKIRERNGIDAGNKHYVESYDVAQIMARPLFEKRPELMPIKNIVSTRLTKCGTSRECRYCGKPVPRKTMSWYCDETCRILNSRNRFSQIRHMDRLTENDYKEVVWERLEPFNKKYNRNVSSRDFTVALKELSEKNTSLGVEAIYFYAYYIAARRSCANYITYHDMMCTAGNIKKWHGIKRKMLEATSCKLENRVTSMFKKYCSAIVRASIIPARHESTLLNCYDSLGIPEMTFNSHPKSVAVTLIYTMLSKFGVNYKKKDFFNIVNMSHATAWKKSGAVMARIENPGNYHKKKKEPARKPVPAIPPATIVAKPAVAKSTVVDASTLHPMIAARMAPGTTDTGSLRASIFLDVIAELKKQIPSLVITNIPVPEQNVHAVYIDMNNLYYIAKIQMGDHINMERIVQKIDAAILAVDPSYKVENVTGHVYVSKHLRSIKDSFNANFKSYKGKDISDQFEWFYPNERKFEKGVEKDQDVDTFLVADAIDEIATRASEIKHVVLASSDKDLVPVLKKAQEKGIWTTVIGYRKYMPTAIFNYANKVCYID